MAEKGLTGMSVTCGRLLSRLARRNVAGMFGATQYKRFL
jgi:hypothetical protein